MTILVPPGSYSVKLTVDGQEFTQPLTVLKDPNSAGSDADISRQMTLLWDLRKDMESAADMVNQIESIRAQLDNLETLLKTKELTDAAEDVDKKLIDIEENLIQRRLTGQGQDTVRWPPKLIGKLNYLASGVGGSDFAPTTQQQEVYATFKSRLTDLRRRLDAVIGTDLSNFNRLLREKNIGNIIASEQ